MRKMLNTEITGITGTTSKTDDKSKALSFGSLSSCRPGRLSRPCVESAVLVSLKDNILKPGMMIEVQLSE